MKKTNEQVVKKRLDSTSGYVDALQNKFSKLLIIRMDMSYKKPHSDEITLDDANKDYTKLSNSKRSKPSIFKDQVGYICKKEYTKDKGVHFHAYFFFDGNKVKNDKFKADQIGKYWNEQITDKKGSYHNCNRNEYKNNGVGMLEHKDYKKRENLDIGVSYLCKTDQPISQVKSNTKDRALVRGTMPKSKVKVGRPRK